MKTTLNTIRSKNPCSSGWSKLLLSLGKTVADDEPLGLGYILKSNGIEDAIWALRCFGYKEYCLFLAEVAESVLPIFEKHNSKDDRPRKAIEAIRSFHCGDINKEELDADAAYAAAAAAYAAAAAAAAYAAADAAYAAAAAAAAAAADAAAAAAAAAAADAAAAAADADAARKAKWEEIEQLFIKYFCEGV